MELSSVTKRIDKFPFHFYFLIFPAVEQSFGARVHSPSPVCPGSDASSHLVDLKILERPQVTRGVKIGAVAVNRL